MAGLARALTDCEIGDIITRRQREIPDRSALAKDEIFLLAVNLRNARMASDFLKGETERLKRDIERYAKGARIGHHTRQKLMERIERLEGRGL